MGHPRDGDVLPSAPLQRLRRPAPPRRDEAGSHPDDPYRRSILGVFSIPHHKPTGKLLMTLPHPTDSSETTLTQELFNAIRYYLGRSEEHTSELQSLMRISYADFCLKNKN